MIEYISGNLEDTTAIEALDILITDFGDAEKTITFTGTQRVVTLKALRREYDGLSGVLAKHISPLSFFGGPLDSRSYYTGSLLTMLCARVMIAWCIDGSYLDMVEDQVC